MCSRNLTLAPAITSLEFREFRYLGLICSDSYFINNYARQQVGKHSCELLIGTRLVYNSCILYTSANNYYIDVCDSPCDAKNGIMHKF